VLRHIVTLSIIVIVNVVTHTPTANLRQEERIATATAVTLLVQYLPITAATAVIASHLQLLLILKERRNRMNIVVVVLLGIEQMLGVGGCFEALFGAALVGLD
jgi:hypothetical protein